MSPALLAGHSNGAGTATLFAATRHRDSGCRWDDDWLIVVVAIGEASACHS
jgi:hypothetical protein